MAVGIVNTHGVVRLYIALMDHRGLELALDHVVRTLEPFVDIAALELQMRGDISLLVRTVVLVAQSREQDWRPRFHRILYRHYRRQDFIIDLDQPQSFLGYMWARGGNRGHGMAVVEDFAPCEDIGGKLAHIDGHLTRLLHLICQR